MPTSLQHRQRVIAHQEGQEPLHSSGSARAAIAVLKELRLYETASAGCIAVLTMIIGNETAAPDMLAALKGAVRTRDKAAFDQARAVIAKATVANTVYRRENQ